MKVKINNEEYKASLRKGIVCDNFYKRGLIVNDVKLKFLYTHSAYVDGYHTGFICKPLVASVIVTMILIVTAILCIALNLGNLRQKVEVTLDNGIREEYVNTKLPGNKDAVLLRYNKYLTYTNGKVDLMLVNEKYEATITIEGDGISAEEMKIKPDEEVPTFDIKINNKERLLSANLIYKYKNNVCEYPIVIENLYEEEDDNKDTTFENEEVIYE